MSMSKSKPSLLLLGVGLLMLLALHSSVTFAAAQTNILVNPGFEDGMPPYMSTINLGSSFASVRNAAEQFAHTGSYYVYTQSRRGQFYQTVTIPENCLTLDASLFAYAPSADTAFQIDPFNITVTAMAGFGYQQFEIPTIPCAPYAGQTIDFGFSINYPGAHPALYLDDFALIVTPFPGTNGDPQFSGFSGQSYQIHGVSDAVYNVLSTPQFQLNAHFTFLEQGRCRKGTQCFSHPGNYFGSVGVLVRRRASDLQSAVAAVFDEVVITAGAVDVGLTVVINNSSSPLAVGSSVSLGGESESKLYSLSLPSAFEVRLESSEFSLRISNSDFFLNQDVSIGDDLLAEVREYKRAVKAVAAAEADKDMAAAAQQKAKAAALQARLPHGLLGQSWNTATYNNRWKHIEGTLTDYQLADGLTGTAFKYNRF